MAESIADFLIRQRQTNQANSIGAAQVVLGSVETKPDEVAADLNLADEFGKATGNPVPPLPMVTEYRGVFAQAVERSRNNTILSSAPKLSDWLRDPKNAALAKDALPELGWWESGWQSAGNSMSRGVMRLPQSYNQWLAQGAAERAGDQQLGFGAILADQMAIKDAAGNIIPQSMSIPGPDDVFGAGMRFVTSRLSGLTGSDQQQQATFYQQQAGEIAKRIAAIPMSEGGERFKKVFGTLGKSGDVMADLGQFATSVAADPAGFMAFITETAVESAPSIAAATAATVVTRNPVAGATVLGGYSGAVEMGTAPVDFFQEKGIDVSTPEGAMAVIANPALMREAANRGVIRGLIVGAMDGLSGGIAGKALAASPLGNVALQALTQAAMGAAGEAGAQVASGQQFNIAEVMLEGLAEFVTAPIEVAGVGGRVFVDGQRKAADAEARKVLFEELSGQATNSVLRARMPVAFQDFVAKATANGPVENVYVPAGEFVTYFQGIGVDPNAIVSELGLSQDDLDVALAGGGDLQIPTAVYATKIAGSEHDRFLMENMRFDPDEFTSREAAEFNAKAEQAMQEAWDVAENLRVEQDQLRTFEQEIYDTMVGRLRAAGRSTDVATTEALLYPAFYRVMAERSQMTVDEFMAAYPLPKVEGSLPEGMQFKDVDALNRTLAEARARKTAGLAKRGPSLLEFISDRGGMIDPGGELRARDAETIKRGKGKKNLRLARGGVLTGMADLLGGNSGGAKFGVDAVAQAAIEAGYLANDPVVMEYQNAMREGREVPDITRALWDAVDRELRGEGVYVDNAQADAADEQTAALDQIEAYLAEIGASLDEDDATIKAKIEADQAGRQYAQASAAITETEAFKRWFGGSKVVDKDGKPLAVYHGTDQEFDQFDTMDFGSWFGVEKGTASNYGNRGEGEQRILPVYLRIEKPFVVPSEIDMSNEYSMDDIISAVNEANGTDISTDDLDFYADQDTTAFEVIAFDEGFLRAVRERGFDGLSAYEEGVLTYNVFSPEQVKSVDNAGTFDPADPVIYNQPAYHGTPHLFDKFSTDHIGSGEGAQAYGWGLYFASEKAISIWYREQLAGKTQITFADDVRLQDLLGGDDVENNTYRAEWANKNLNLGWDLSDQNDADELGAIVESALTAIRYQLEAEGQSIDEALETLIENQGKVVAGYQRIIDGLQPAESMTARASVAKNMRAIRSNERVREVYEGMTATGYKPEVKQGGRLFEVDVPSDDELLNWDAPLGEQPEAVKAALESLGINTSSGTDFTDAQTSAIAVLDRTLSAPGYKHGDIYDLRDLLAGDELSTVSEVVDAVSEVMKRRIVGNPNVAASVMPEWRSLLSRLRNDAKGKSAYEELSDKLGGDEKASRALAAAGVPGHQYFGDSSGSTNYVIYNDQRVQVLRYEQQNRGSIQFPGGGVGSGDTIIRLFENADLSTTIHESGHYFLTVMQDLAANGEQQSVDAMSAVKSWWNENADAVAKDAMRVMPDVTVTGDDVRLALDAGTTGDVMKDAAIDVGMQEQFARGFEAYLMEGKAPSAELRGAFEKFRAWLISIYQRLAGLNVKLSDGVREVFDRMIASDAEIAKAKAESGDTGPIFTTAEAMGLTPEQYAAFVKLRAQAEDDAKARMLREVMAPVKRAQEKWFKDERTKLRTDVERNINVSPVFRAMEWMGNRRWLGEDQPEQMPDIRLSKDILVERYGEGVLKTLPRGKQTVYAVEGGLDPDDAAGWFGFDSGDQMIRAMERAPNRKEAIEAETDKMMRDRHGDVLNDGRIEAEALDVVHSDKRGQWIAAELKAIHEVAGLDVGLTAKEARASARQTVARMRVRDAMNANRFLSAERKAGDEAAKLGAQLARDKVWLDQARNKIGVQARKAAKGNAAPDTVATAIDGFNSRFETTQTTYQVDAQTRTAKGGGKYTIPAGERTTTSLGYNDLVAALADAKRRQLINHALYMEARNVADEVEKAERFVAKLGKATHREKIAGAGRRENAQVDYLGAIDELLERYDFRKSSGTADQRRGSLAAFIETMKAAGRENELAIPDAVLADAARRPYKTLPVEELRGVVDSLKNLEHMALRWDKLIDAQQQRELEAVVDDITAAFDANLPKRPPGRVRGPGDGARNVVRQFFDLVLNATTLLREIDGFKDGGAAYRNIKAPIDDAQSRLIERKEKAAADLEALYSVYTVDERRRMAVREHMPELGYALSKWERIAAALNTGNAGNLQRLTDKRVRGALNPAQVQAVLASLDERDAAFIQSVWDYVGSFRDDIAARERRTTGVEPAWVEASPVVIAGKTLRGGYYPLKYDPRLSSLARDDAANDISQSLQAGRFGKAQTRNGHTKERAQSSGRDIELDMSVLHRHVNQVIYDLELSEPVANSWRVLQNARIRSAFTDAGKQADFDALEIWLLDVGQGELKSADLVGRGARMLKSNFTAAKLALNLGTVLAQVTGIAQSAVVVGKKNMAIGVQQSFRVGVGDEIAAKSDFMRSRQTTFNKDIFDFYNDPLTGPALSKWGDFKQKWVGPLSFWLMTKVQWYAADIPTWLAGYHQGLAKFGNDEAQAIAHADNIVKRAQASGLFSDRSAVERGSVSRNARQNDVVRLFTALGSYMFAKFNVAYERSAVAGRTISQEGVSVRSAQEALSWTVDMAFLFTLEAVVMSVVKGWLTGLGGDDDEEKKPVDWPSFIAKQTALGVVGTIPFVRDLAGPLQGFSGGGAYGAITGELTRPIQQAMQGEVDAALVKSVISATGLAAGLPATQINRAVDAAWRQVEGENVAPLEYLLGKSRN